MSTAASIPSLQSMIEKSGGVSMFPKEHISSPEILLNAPRSNVRTILKFCNTHFLRPGRISTAIAPIGTGKSQLSEALVSSHVNPHSDTLGMEIIHDGDRPLLLIDFERSSDEILEGTDRIKRRISAENNPDLLDEERFKSVFIHGFLQYPKTEDKVNELELLINKYNPSLVILDGSASLVYDVNDTKECVSTIALLGAIADQNKLSFFCTVHPNPDQKNDFKPRGVFGSELLRVSESVLLLKRAVDDRDTRVLTTSFLHGKNRSGPDALEHYFKWNPEQMMFLSSNYSGSPKAGKIEGIEATFNTILSDGKELTHTNLMKELMAAGGCKSVSTAKRKIKDGIELGVIFNKDGNYRYTPF